MIKKLLPVAAFVAALAIPGTALAANEYDITAKYSPTKSGTAKNPRPVSLNFGFKVQSTEPGRPFSLEALTATFQGTRINTAGFRSCSVSKIERAQSDESCGTGSLVATGFARNLAGNRANRADASIRCYLTLRLHIAGRNRMALFVKGDPTAAGDKNCPVGVATAIPVTIRPGTNSQLKLSIPESLKHPLPTLTNALVEVDLKVRRKTRKVRGKTIGAFETVRCVRGSRNVDVTFDNEEGNVGKARGKARCSS